MFFKKVKTNELIPKENINNYLDIVSCGECGCLIEKRNAQKIKSNYDFDLDYYCLSHKRNYSRIEYKLPFYQDQELQKKYFKEVEVNEKGFIINNKNK